MIDFKTLRKDLRFPFWLWVGTRLALVLCSELTLRLPQHLNPNRDFSTLEHESVLRPYPSIDGFCRWDCGWYLRIVRHGYRMHVEANLWPLYPLISRIFHEITRINMIVSMIIVSNVACLVS